MHIGAIINSYTYVDTLLKLKRRLKRVQPNLEMFKVLLQYDNARPYTSLKTRKVTTSFGWTTATHPPYSPDLATSDYHLFGPLKEGIGDQHFSDDKKAKQAVKAQPTRFYKVGIHVLFHR